MSNYFKERKHEVIIFIIFFSYFYTWHNLNFNFVQINNNSLSTAIEIYSYTPYVSLILDNLFQYGFAKIFSGNILFPSLVSFIFESTLAKL